MEKSIAMFFAVLTAFAFTICPQAQAETFTITATAGADGSISPAGPVTAENGSSTIFTFTPDAGYRVADVLVDGVSVGPVIGYAFNAVTANHSISVSFAASSARTVTNLNDSGSGSLRQAIADAANGDSIDFAPGLNGVITTQTELLIDKYVIIAGPGAGLLMISRSTSTGNFSVFRIGENGNAAVSGLSIANGKGTTEYSSCRGTAALGGGILNHGNLILKSCGIRDNTADSGGGIYSGMNSGRRPLLAVLDSAIFNNSTAMYGGWGGGGIQSCNGDTAVINSTISGNASSAYGGGICSYQSNLTIDFSTIANNTSSYSMGGVALYYGSSSINNSILSGNNNTDCYSWSGSGFVRNSLIKDGSCGAQYSGDAKLGGLVDNGGTTPTHALLPGSPALDRAGSCAGVDQRGVARPQGTSCDLGAYEFSAAEPRRIIVNATARGNGSISPSGTTPVNYDDSQTFSITPAPGNYLMDVTVDGTSVGPVTSYAFNYATTDHTIVATFSRTITASAGAGGSIYPAGAMTVDYGSAKVFSIVPDAGYKVADVLVDGQSAGAVISYSFTSISTNHTIAVTFAASPVRTVTNLNDSGPGSLRQAIADAASGDTIDFASGLSGVITTQTELFIDKYVIIAGPGADLLTISRSASTGNFSVVRIGENGNADLQGLSVSNGRGTSEYSNCIGTTPLGGGILNHGNLTLRGCSIHDNTAGSGAGIFSGSNSGKRPVLEILDSAIYNNASTGSWGGGITSCNAEAAVKNSTVSGNTLASNYGGGIASMSSNLTLDFSTIANNSASWLGGVAVYGGWAEINNSIISGHNVDCYSNGWNGSTIIVRNSLIKDGNCGAQYSGDAKIGGLTDNGGPTPTHALLPGSPALDRAGACAGTDQRGVVRPQPVGDTCDLGAYEFTAASPQRIVITATARGNGSISPAGSTPLNYGDSQTFTITPDAGNYLMNVVVDGTSVGPVTSYTFNFATTDHTIVATFSRTITATAGAGGEISPSGTVTVDYGSSAVYAITPDAGYRVSDVTVDGQSVGAVINYAFDAITANHTIAVTFAASPVRTVANLNDSGPGSLRQTIADAAAGDTIGFDPGLTGVITTQTELFINKYLIINGPGADHLTVSRSTTTGNFSVFRIGESGNAVLSGLAIANGSGTSEYSNCIGTALFGGGILNHGNLAMQGCTVHDNTAHSGGGIYNGSNSGKRPLLEVRNSAIYNNTVNGGSWSGGGIRNCNADAAVINSTISGNTSNGSAAGMGSTNSHVTIDFSTIADNTSQNYSGMMFSGGWYSISNSAITGNGTPYCYNANNPSLGVTRNSLIKDGSCGAQYSGDPKLGGLTNNGGATPTHALLPGSPALDRGGACTGSDQRGTARPQGAACDLGAYEYSSAELPRVVVAASVKGNGALSPVGPVPVNYGESATFSITPDAGNYIVNVVVDGVSVGAVTSYTFANATTNHTIAATFSRMITATAGAGGSITPSGALAVDYGGSKSFVITPDTGYTVSDVLVDGKSVGAAVNYTFNNITADHTITATFTGYSTLTVTNLNDSGSGSLRQAIADAASGDTIDFAPGLTGVITTQSELRINKNLIIMGPGADLLTISRNTSTGNFSVVNIGESGNAIIRGLSITKGSGTTENSPCLGTVPLGGGIVNHGNLWLYGCSVHGNTAGYGAGIYNGPGGAKRPILEVYDSAIHGNAANGGWGGGITSCNADVAVINSTISGNSIGSYGGGIAGISSVMTIEFSTIANNTAASWLGGVAVYGGSARINNSIIADNGAGDCYSGWNGGAVTVTNSLIRDGSCSPQFSGDAKLGGLTDNGGTTPTHALLPGSPALDRAGVCTGADQRGVTRPQGTTCDLGAYEYSAAEPLHILITASARGNGSISPSGVLPTHYGESLTFSITPAAGNYLMDVLVDGVSVGPVNSYTFTTATMNHTISATFSQAITATAGSHGSISPAGALYVDYGSNKVFTITPDDGYRVADVLVDGQSIGAAISHAFNAISADHTIEASFAPSPKRTVSNLNNSGPGSLRQAIADAAPGDTIEFAPGLTGAILTQAELLIDKYLIIIGPGADVLTIRRNTAAADFSVFHIGENVSAVISGLAISNGKGTTEYSPCIGTAQFGGGILNHGNLTLKGCSISGNTAGYGAGVFNGLTSGRRPILEVYDSAIHGNAASGSWGGGIMNCNADAVVKNSTVSGNTLTSSYGGGIASMSSNLTLDFSTIAENSASWLGGVAVYGGRAEINNSIISGHNVDCYSNGWNGSTIIVRNSLIKDGSCGAQYSGDPKLGGLTNNGGATPTLALLPGSPVLDRAGACTGADQRGVARPQGPACDLGAYEFSAAEPQRVIVTTSARGNGNISPAGAAPVNFGGSQTFTMTPTAGNYLVDVLVDGVSVGAVNSYTFSSTTGNHTISATFSQAITATAGPHGSIAPAGVINVNYGSNKLFAITPDAGYRVSEVLVDGRSIGAAIIYSMNSITADHTIAVSFAPSPKRVVTNLNSSGPGSLMQTIAESASGDTIEFAPGLNGVITIQTGIFIDKYLVIAGPGADKITIRRDSAAGNFSVVRVGENGNAAISGLSLSNGRGTTEASSCAGTVSLGGGILNLGNLTLKGCSIHGNTAQSGGGVYNGPSSGKRPVLDMTDTAIFNNSATGSAYTWNGGGMHNCNADIIMNNSTISRNSSSGYGGGMTSSGSNVTVGFSTIADNTAAAYGGVAFVNGGWYVIGNSLIANPVGSDCYNGNNPPMGVVASSLIKDGSCGAQFNGDAKLGGLADNGGATPTHALLPGSPALDKVGACSGTDQRGVSRPQNGMCDLGAYEFAEAEPRHVIITASARGNGTISPAGPTPVDYSGNQTYAITPADGSYLVDVAVDGVSVGIVTNYTFTTATANHTIVATFSRTITAAAGTGGTISPSGAVTVDYGSSRIFTLSPDPGYRVADVLVDGQSIGAAIGYSFNSITADHTITASFTVSPKRTVTNLNDAGAGSLRQAIADAVPGDTIEFAPELTGEITTQSELFIDKYLIIAGPGADVLTVSRNPSAGNFSLFRIGENGQVFIGGLSVTNGKGTTEYSSCIGTVALGGGILNHGNLQLKGCSIHGNTANAGGGVYNGMTNNRRPMLDVIESAIHGNSTTQYGGWGGGGVHVCNADATIINSTISGNASSGYGGGISSYGSTIRIDFSTIAGNTTTYSMGGVALYNGRHDISNTVISGNNSTECYFWNWPGTVKNTLVKDGSCGAQYSGDAKLGTLMNNGGTTPTHSLLSGSLALDQAGACTGTDQRGVTRPQGAACELGAYEAMLTGPDHTLTASAGPNGAISPSGATTVNYGGRQTYTMVPNSGYHVADVLVDGTSVGAVNTYTFLNVVADHTINASFTNLYTVQASAGANGGISPAGTTTVPVGGSLTYTITPNPGYYITNVVVDGISIGAATTYIFNNVNANHTITASFAVYTYAITATAGANGVISPSGTVSVNHGASSTFTITPNAAYGIVDVLVDGASAGAVASYTFTNVTGPHTIAASFTNIVPIASTGGPYWTGTGHAVTLDGTGSIATSGRTIVQWEWDLNNDGIFETPGSRVTTTWSPAGVYPVTLRITDDSLPAKSATATTTVTVEDVPVVSITTTAGSLSYYGEAVTFSASAGSHIASYEWTSSRDDALSNLQSFTTGNLSIGTHTITCRVTDILGRVSNNSITFIVFSQSARIDLALEWGDISFWQNGVEVTNPGENDQITIRATIHNLSSEATSSAGAVSVFDTYITGNQGQTLLGNVALPSIAPNGTATVELLWTPDTQHPQPGFHVIQVTAAQSNNETHLNNNTATHHLIRGDRQAAGNVSIDVLNLNVYNQQQIYVGTRFTLSGYAQYHWQNGYLLPVLGGKVTIRLGEQTYEARTGSNGWFYQEIVMPLAPGAYTLTVEVSDSTINGQTQRTLQAVVPAGPDLTVYNVYLANGVAEMPETVYAYVVNRGGVAVTGAFDTYLEIAGPSGEIVFTAVKRYNNAGGLCAGCGTTIAFDGWTPAAAGTYRAMVTTDYNTEIDESDESNNTAMVMLRVYPHHVDLEVAEITKSCNVISARIVNHGGLTSTVTGTLHFADAGGDYSVRTPIPAVTGKDSYGVWVSAAAYPGSSSNTMITVSAESGEDAVPGNNSRSATFDFRDRSDLTVTNLRVNDQSWWGANVVYISQPNNLWAEVRNLGCTAAGGTLQFSVDGTVRGDVVTVPVIPGGGSVIVSTTFDFAGYVAATNYTLSAVVTIAAPQTDAVPGNNTYAEGLRVSPQLPDYRVYSEDINFSFDPGRHPARNEKFTISADIHNVGLAEARQFKVAFYEEGQTLIGVVQTIGMNPGIQPGSSLTVYPRDANGNIVTWGHGFSGNHAIMVTVSPLAGLQDDPNDTDNSATRKVWVNHPPQAKCKVKGKSKNHRDDDTVEYSAEESNDDLDLDGKGGIIRYDWNFGDGQHAFSTGPAVVHTYLTPGNYIATVTVVDNNDESTPATASASVPHQISASAGPGGTISPSGTQSVAPGASQSFTITPGTGYHVTDVIVDGQSQGALTAYTFSSVSTDHTISVSFALNIYTITASAGAHGSLSTDGTVTVGHGSSSQFTITPDMGYHIADVLVDLVSVGAVTTYTFSNVTSDHAISATFAINTYTVTPTVGPNGTLLPSAAQTIDYGQTAVFTAATNTGYHIASVTGCNGTLNGNTYTTGPVTDDCTVSATFAVNTYTVTPNAGPNGSLLPSAAQTIDYGQTAVFTSATNTGYHIASVTGCNGTLNGNTYTTGPVTADCTVSATFAVNTYTVTPTAGPNGAISPSTAQTVTYNQTGAFTVTPNTGYRIASVTGCSGTLVGNTYTTGPVTADCTVSATFTASTYTLTVNKAGTGSGTVTSSPSGINCGGTCSASFTNGTQVALTAATSTDSLFVGWSGGGCSGTGACVTTMDAAKTVTATFNQYITVTSPNGGEVWRKNTTYTIRWNYSENPGTNVKIELLRGGVLSRTITNSTSIGSNGSGSYNWRILNSQTAGTNYTIRITSTTNSNYKDTSNANFTIQ